MLKLSSDEEGDEGERVHSQIEGDGWPYIRLLVANEPGKRAARGTRVLVDRCWPTYTVPSADNTVTLGAPSLAWTSAREASDGSLVVFAGASRVVDLGLLGKFDDEGLFVHPSEPIDQYPWRFKLRLHDLALKEHREILAPERWTIRLILGADEVDGRAYDVDIVWAHNASDAKNALASTHVNIRPVSV